MANVHAFPSAEGSRILTQWRLKQERARKSTLQAPLRKGFAAAEISRLTASMAADHNSLNTDLEYSLRLIVGRSRNQAKNNDYVRRFLAMCQTHIVGPEGFSLHVPCLRQDGTIDEADSQFVQQAFARWARLGSCDVTGRLSFRLLCRLLVLHAARDGEALVRRVRRQDHPFGYQLQVIDPVLLDYGYRADLPGGNKIRMGVEVDSWSRPVAYHLLSSPDSGLAQTRTRVPASEIWHFFLQEEAGQVRGVPWIYSALRRLADLGGFEQAAVIASRVGASQMAFYMQAQNPEGGAVDPAEIADGREDPDDPMSDLVEEAEPGSFKLLPPGVTDVKAFNPKYPHENYGPFVKACLRGVASGLGVDYNTLANDLEGVNYSSIRHGMLDTREAWMALQNWIKESFLQPLYTEWLDMAFVSGQLGSLPVSKFAKYDCCDWQGRRWPWVDPLNDAKATEIQLDRGITSVSAVIRERGQDPEAVFRQIEKDKKRLADLLPAAGGTATPAKAAPAAP